MLSIRPWVRLGVLLGAPMFLLSVALWGGGSPNGDVVGSGRYDQHPPLGHTGGFGEPTCHVCHFGGELNGGAGTLRISELSDTVRAGETVAFSVELAAAMERSGFMLALRRGNGEQAGTLTAVDTGRVAIDTPYGSDVQYAYHTLAGTALADSNRTRWTLEWTAPPADADSVLVHVAANAANDDASEFGDDIYATSRRVVVRP